MNVKDILKKFNSEKPNSEVLMITNVNNKVVIVAKTDDTNRYDIHWTIKNDEIIPYSPLDEMIDFQIACQNPLYVKNDSLKHYGIKGQRWGVRRFDYEPVGNRRPVIHDPRQGDGHRRDNTSELRRTFDEYKAASRGHGSGFINFNNFQFKISDSDTDISSLYRYTGTNPLYKNLTFPAGSVYRSQSLAHINPGYNTGDYYRTHNCPNCAFAVEMNKRGFTNFQANANTPQYMDDILSFYSNERTYSFKTSNIGLNGREWCDEVRKNAGPPGSHGFIAGDYKPVGNAGGHIMNYTVLKDGSIQIEDGQNGRIFTLEAAAKIYNFGSTHVIDMTNAGMNAGKLLQYGVDNTSDKNYVEFRRAQDAFAKELIRTIGNKISDHRTLSKGATFVTNFLRRINK